MKNYLLLSCFFSRYIAGILFSILVLSACEQRPMIEPVNGKRSCSTKSGGSSWTYRFADNYNGADNSQDFGLNNNLPARQLFWGYQYASWKRKAGCWYPKTVQPWFSQVNNAAALDALSFHVEHSAVMLDQLIIARSERRYRVSFSTDPVINDMSSQDWTSVMLHSDSVNRGFVTECNFGFLIRSNGGVEVYQNGHFKNCTGTVKAANEYNIILDISTTQLIATINEDQVTAILDEALPSAVYVYLGAFINTSSFKSTFDDLVIETKNAPEPPAIIGTPLVWGVDYAGYTPNSSVEDSILDDFGFDLVVRHYYPRPSREWAALELRGISHFYEANKVKWILNFEDANYTDSYIDDQGYDWYNRADGRHYFMFPDDILDSLSTLSHKPGVMYDEAAHMQNSRNYTLNKPYFLNATTVSSLEDASGAFIQKANEIAGIYQEHGLQLYSEHVFPVNIHTLADAGFIPVTKILKENNIPAYIACALGAAIQYDTPFWLTPDLWFFNDYPGHNAKQYKSALLMAYHMGAEGIYTENLGYSGDGSGSLIKVDADGNGYQKTTLGDIAKWFRWEYAPANPRSYAVNDLIPKIAIIRQEDACWGQSDSWLKDELFGNTNWPSTSTTAAWLEIWHLLSNDKIPKESISWHNNAYSETPYQVFYPLDGVVVFDEKVEHIHLTNVELIFLTGLKISTTTLNAVQLRVQAGATCISLPHLAPDSIYNQTGNNGSVIDGQGLWVVTESFLSTVVREAVQPFLPTDNFIRYKFGNTEVRFTPVDGDNDEINVIFIN
jgi:hypothetical protein